MKQAFQQAEMVGIAASGLSLPPNESSLSTPMLSGNPPRQTLSAAEFSSHHAVRQSRIEQTLEYQFIRGFVFLLLIIAGTIAFMATAVAGLFGVRCHRVSPLSKARTHTRICMPYLFHR